ncbi:hypothetical protein Thimo_0811 [Thioflavicoccus mobilis 8321]|uniref:Uncharacterized protein n=2 Tax=Thioflavicoccus mobilis TaxID=80679 RepID=L0GW99_9GAMM|nr:hypothetical protein Thimo_0811 [Thioflavicoccus mobilis 8321]
MSAHPRLPSRTSPTKQRGVAALLIILLTGLSLSAVVLGVVYDIQRTQEQVVAVSAQTQAQIKAWMGAKILREYLVSLDTDAALPDEGSITLSGVDGIAVDLHDLVIDGNRQDFTFDISSAVQEEGRSHATSQLRVVYERLLPSSSENCGGDNGEGSPTVIQFNKNLNLSGSINVQGAEGEAYEINVNGDVTTGGNSIKGVDIIRATGSIQIGSGSSFDTLLTNGDVQLTGSVAGEQNIQARGNVCLSGGASADGVVKANGSVTGAGSASFGSVSAIGESDNTGTQLCGILYDDAYGDPFAVDLRNNSSADSVLAKGSVRISSGSIGLSGSTADSLQAEQDLVDTNWGGTEYGEIGGVLRISGSNPAIAGWIRVVTDLTVDITPIALITIETQTFDARPLAAIANYAFSRVDGYKQVTVHNVSDIADGDYFLFDDSGPYRDYLCPVESRASDSTTSKPRCTIPAASLKTICKGQSNYNSCFSYDVRTDEWKISGKSMAPGVAWFDGNLELGNGDYFNTFIATSNISTGGSLDVYAPNFAGYSGQVGDTVYSPTGICDNDYFPDTYPTQFCSGDTYNEDANGGIGNFALMAGSCASDDCTTYVGGNVTLGASNDIHGNIKAGNQFVSGGSTTLWGYASALGLGTTTQNKVGGSTTIILDNLPPTFAPESTGSGTGDTGDDSGGCSSEDTSTDTVVTVLRSRYR